MQAAVIERLDEVESKFEHLDIVFELLTEEDDQDGEFSPFVE